MEPTDLPDKHSKSDAIVSGGVHGGNRADDDKHLSKSLWQPRVVQRLADYIKQLREVDDESNQRPVTSQSSQPVKPQQSRHVCTRNPHRTCNCYAGVCADDDATYRYARGKYGAIFYDQFGRVRVPDPNHLGNFNCPIDNKLCSADVCREWCEGSGSGPETDADRSNAEAAKHR